MSIEALLLRYGAAYRWLATMTVMVATIAVVLSTTIVNVAIPDVMGAFGISQVQAQWISTGFLAAMTVTMLLTDWVYKSLGLKAGMIVAMLVFLVGSILGGIAPNEGILTLARVVQGAAAGLVQPLAMILLFQVFPIDQRGMAMGIYGIGVVLAPALGPWIGGMLIDTFNWHYVFFLGLPFAVLGIVLSNIFLPVRVASASVPRFDWPGLILLCVFVATALNGLTNAQRMGWGSDPILWQFMVSVFAIGAFIVWELYTDKPMLDLRIFSRLPFAAAALVSFILGAGLFGSLYLVPLFVQTIQGLTPTQAGLLLMPSGLVLILIFPMVGYLSDRLPIGVLIGTGMVIFAWASYLTAQVTIATSFGLLAWWTVLSRIGLGFVFPSLTAGSLKVLPPEWVGQGAGAINFTRQLGGAFGVNLLAVLLERRTEFHADALAHTQSGGNPATLDLIHKLAGSLNAAGLPDFQQVPAALAFLAEMITAQASTLAFQDGFLIVTVIFLVALGPTWLLHRAVARRGAISAPGRGNAGLRETS
ncbi:DHA2 family efflux MFS transporter permease subunit [Alcaligenaceae bacterium]|nr:DHA2 family efflux MFS transporter permease subunit [Alcaligenaceae bacterium]